jgi:hypothetical protein
MKGKLLACLLFLTSTRLFAQQNTPAGTQDTELTDLFLTYWPVVLLPIFMIVIWGAYRRRNRRGK